MKPNSIMAGILCVCLFFATIFPLQAQPGNRKGLKKGVNLALNITDKKKQPPCTYLNLGIISNYSYLNGIGINALSSVTHFHSKGFQIAGLTNITGLNAAGFQLSGIANVTGGNARGILWSGLMNVSGRNIDGVALSGIGNMSGKDNRGFIIGGLINVNSGNSAGVMVAGIASVTGKKQSGLMLGGLMNASGGTLRGMQLASLANIAGMANNGVQIAALGNITVTNRGVQAGFCNYSAENKGLQMGLANIAGKGHKGLQFGLFNLSADSLAHQVGCVNISPRTRIQLLVSSGNLNKANVAVRFKNKCTYTELGGGAYFFSSDHGFSASAFYRAGVYYPLCRWLDISADAGYYHIETLDNEHKGYPARIYALQPRLNLEFRLNHKVGFFASGGYAWTRQYGHNHTFGRKGTFEAGIVLF